MRTLLKALAVCGLLLVIVPPLVAYGEATTPPYVKQLMLVGTGVWFIASYLGFRGSASSIETQLEEEHTPVA